MQSDKPLYESISKELYDRARIAARTGNTSEFEPWQIGCIEFLASFNGRGFDGGYAKSKVCGNGKYRDFYAEGKNNVEIQRKNPLFKDCDFRHMNYLDLQVKGAVIYCDPPYEVGKKYANSTHFDYDEFWQTMREWSKDNIVLISEQNAPDDFECIWEKETKRYIQDVTKEATEKLFKFREIS